MSREAFHFKLVLLGNSGVGKSSLVLRFIKKCVPLFALPLAYSLNRRTSQPRVPTLPSLPHPLSEFFEEVETTIGAAFLTKSLALEDCTVKMEVR